MMEWPNITRLRQAHLLTTSLSFLASVLSPILTSPLYWCCDSLNLSKAWLKWEVRHYWHNMRMHIYIYLMICICTYFWYVCINIYIYKCLDSCMCMYVCVYVLMCVYEYVYMYYVFLCIYIYINIMQLCQSGKAPRTLPCLCCFLFGMLW